MDQDHWFKFWQQAVATQLSVMGSVAGLGVTSLAVVAGFAQTTGGLNGAEKVIIVLVAVLLGLHVM